MFNKAAKNITVDESETGEVKVDMNIDKSDLSTKKMRKKMMKKVRNQLYSNFVKSGTLTGGKMEEVEKEEQMEVVKDLSKIKELSDDQLVAACGGLTAHKGGRHGLNMKAKLDRIAEAEREFLEKYGGAGVTKNGSENSSKKYAKPLLFFLPKVFFLQRVPGMYYVLGLVNYVICIARDVSYIMYYVCVYM